MTDTDWRVVASAPGYEVSALGQIRNRRTGRILSTPPGVRDGYRRVGLSSGGVTIVRTVHSLVAEAFLGPRPDRAAQVLLIDGDGSNAASSNLRWGTHRDRAAKAVRQGRLWQQRRTHCPKGHLYDEANTYIRASDGCRQCRACRRLKRRRTATDS